MEASTREVGIRETKGRRGRRGSREKERGKEEEEETEKGENGGSKESSIRMGDMGRRRGSSKVRGGSKEVGTREIL